MLWFYLCSTAFQHIPNSIHLYILDFKDFFRVLSLADRKTALLGWWYVITVKRPLLRPSSHCLGAAQGVVSLFAFINLRFLKWFVRKNFWHEFAEHEIEMNIFDKTVILIWKPITRLTLRFIRIFSFLEKLPETF